MKKEKNISDVVKSYRNAYYFEDIDKMNKLESKAQLTKDEQQQLLNIKKALRTELQRLLLQFKMNSGLDSADKDSLCKRIASLSKQAGPALIDWVQPDIDRTVWAWDYKGEADDALHSNHKKKIYDELHKALDKFGYKNYDKWITGARILGSLASYQYNSESDLDSHFFVDIDKCKKDVKYKDEELDEIKVVKDLDDVIRYLNREAKPALENTRHDIEYYFEIYKDNKKHWIKQAVVSPDHGEYDLDADKWLKDPPPIRYDFNVETMFPGMVFGINKVVEEFDATVGEIRRDAIAIKRLQETVKNWQKQKNLGGVAVGDVNYDDRINYFQDKLNIKLNEINEDSAKLTTLAEQFKALKDEEKKMSSKFGFGELTFKYLQKYGYLYMAAKLTDIKQEEGGKIPLSRIQEVEEIVTKPREKR